MKGHPDVLDAIVVGMPDDRYGEQVVALVQPKPGRRIDAEGAPAIRPRPVDRVQGAEGGHRRRRDRAVTERQAGLPLGAIGCSTSAGAETARTTEGGLRTAGRAYGHVEVVRLATCGVEARERHRSTGTSGRLSKDGKAAFSREAIERGLHGLGDLLVALADDGIVLQRHQDRMRASGSVRTALR